MPITGLMMQAVRNGGTSPYVPTPGPAYETEASALFARMSTQPSGSRKTAINDLIAGLKADGIWSKLSCFFDLAAETDEQQALLDWTRSATATNNGCGFTANAGYRPATGPSNWVDLGFAPNVRGDTLNSIAAGVWTNIQGTSSASAITQFSTTGSSRNDITANNTSGATAGIRANDAITLTYSGIATRTGHRAYSRTGPGARAAYLAGASVASDSTASTAVGLGNFCLFRTNASYNILNDSICFAWVSQGLTGTEIGNLHTRLATYKTAAGIV